jgi:hypothetical protein
MRIRKFGLAVVFLTLCTVFMFGACSDNGGDDDDDDVTDDDSMSDDTAADDTSTDDTGDDSSDDDLDDDTIGDDTDTDDDTDDDDDTSLVDLPFVDNFDVDENLGQPPSKWFTQVEGTGSSLVITDSLQSSTPYSVELQNDTDDGSQVEMWVGLNNPPQIIEFHAKIYSDSDGVGSFALAIQGAEGNVYTVKVSQPDEQTYWTRIGGTVGALQAWPGNDQWVDVQIVANCNTHTAYVTIDGTTHDDLDFSDMSAISEIHFWTTIGEYGYTKFFVDDVTLS